MNNTELIVQAHWYADKIPAYGDYAKGAADVLRKLADALEAAQPAPQVPMTNIQIDDAWDACASRSLRTQIDAFARAIEAHHKIGVKP